MIELRYSLDRKVDVVGGTEDNITRLLTQCHNELAGNKAAGIDDVTKLEYSMKLEENIHGLVERLKRHSYKPQAVRRVYIPKDGGKAKRPLGIPAYEDKIVQSGLNKILQAIYEPSFSNNSYGFRPERNCHQALIKLNRIIEHGKINYIVDADIKGFFNNVDHEWIIKFIDLWIKDPNIIKLIKAEILAEDLHGKIDKLVKDQETILKRLEELERD